MHAKRRVCGIIGLALVATLPLLAPAQKARAGTGLGEAIVQPQRDDIDSCREGIKFLDAEAGVRIEEMRAWLGFYQKQFAAVDAKCQTLVKAWDETMAKVKAAKKALVQDEGKGHVPHYGWHTVESLAKHAEALKKQYDDVKDKIQNGDLKVHVQAIGWITRNALQKKIEAHQKTIDIFAKAHAEGTFRAPVSGFDWVSRQSLEGRIEANEKAIEKANALIAAGDYQVHVPTIGWITRNGLEAKIEGVKKAVAGLEATFGDKKANIHRPLFGWMNLTALEAGIGAKQKEYDDYEKHIKTSVWSAHFPATGWLSGKQIEGKIKGLEKSVKSINESVTNGTYPVSVSGFGMLNENQIKGALAALAKQKDVQDKVNALQKGLNAIGTVSDVDIAIYLLDKSMYTSWIAELLKFAKPWLDSKKLDIDQHAAHSDDWAAELALILEQKKRQVDHLKNCLQFVP